MNPKKRKCTKAVVVLIGIIVIPTSTLFAALRDENGLHGSRAHPLGRRNSGHDSDQSGIAADSRAPLPKVQIDWSIFYQSQWSIAVPRLELNAPLVCVREEAPNEPGNRVLAGSGVLRITGKCGPVEAPPAPVAKPGQAVASEDRLREPTRRYLDGPPVESPVGNRRVASSCQTPAAPADTSTDTPAASPSPSPSQENDQDMDQEGNPPAKPAPSEPEPTPPTEPIAPPIDTQAAANEVPLPTNPALPTTYSEWDLAQVESPLFLSAAINEFNERPLMLTGNWSIKPYLSIGSEYDGNIFLRSSGAQSDFIIHAAPGLDMRLGDDDSMFYLSAAYSLGFDIYTEHTGESSIDQNGSAQLQWRMPKTTIDLNLGLSESKGQDVDVGNLVTQHFYYAGLTTHYDFGEKTSWDVNADYIRSDFDGLISSSQAEAEAFFNYQYSPKTEIGTGASIGELTVPGTHRQTYEDANLRASYRLTGKVTVLGEAGMELREYGSGLGDSFTPVFSLSAAWAARPGTNVTLTGRRSIYASAILGDQDYAATSLDITVGQRITDYVDVGLSVGFVNSSYMATAAGVSATREDNYFYVRPSVAWRALDWLSIGFYYEYDQDLSSGGVANGFVRDSGGVDVAVLF